jgi:hypothetical protein
MDSTRLASPVSNMLGQRGTLGEKGLLCVGKRAIAHFPIRAFLVFTSDPWSPGVLGRSLALGDSF